MIFRRYTVRLTDPLVSQEWERNDRIADTTMIIIDAKSIKNTYLASEKGYDGGKKVSGIKLHIGVDILGLPHVMMITTANITDRNGAIDLRA